MSFNGRKEENIQVFKYVTYLQEGVRVGQDLFFFTNYCAGICRKYFLFYFPTTHSLFLSATAALEIGMLHLHENTSNLLERFKCDFLLRQNCYKPHTEFEFVTRVAWNFGVVSSFCVYNRNFKI